LACASLACATVALPMMPGAFASSTLHLLPMPAALVRAGLHVLSAASRYPKNDSGLIMEKVAIDMAAWVKDARGRGYEKVILVGWSGGGSLSLFYQAEAEAPSITATPAGDPIDLTQAGLEPADAVIFIAAHLSRAEILTEWLDPSVTDELDPDRRDLEFDIYDGACPQQPPLHRRVCPAFPGGPDRPQPQNDRVVPGAARRAARLRHERGRTLLRRAPNDVRRAMARPLHRPERPAARLVLSRRSTGRQHLARRARAILIAALLALAVELRSVKRERAEECRSHPPHAGIAGREPMRGGCQIRVDRLAAGTTAQWPHSRTASAIRGIARSISSALVKRPRLKRMEDCASSMESPIDRKTWDGSGSPDVQADPVEAAR
jgi:hypothetical protein